MIRKTETSDFYRGDIYSLFYIAGEKKSLNRYIKKHGEDIVQYLRIRDIPCRGLSISETSWFGCHSVKNLILRNNPTLSSEQLKEAIKRQKNNNRKGRLVFIGQTQANNKEGWQPVVYSEENFGSNNYAESIFAFIDEIIRCEQKEKKQRKTFLPHDPDSGVRFRLPNEEKNEKEAKWDNNEFIATDLLAEEISAVQNEVISPIIFDNGYNIVLPLYPQIKIKLEPLPKALYILMLRHPEGILLKNIGDYTDEIRNIYCKISGRQNPSVISRLLNAITDPTDNPLHKNISLIRKGFLSKLNFEVAQNYIPAHRRSLVQHIPIDKKLVTLPDFL